MDYYYASINGEAGNYSEAAIEAAQELGLSVEIYCYLGKVN